VIEAEVRDFRKFEDEALVSLTRPKVLHGGMLVAVKPTKVPRILGKANTMIKQIAEGTGSSLVVGMNGMLWIKGGDMNLVEKLIREVEEKAHTNGLTDKIKQEIDAYKNPK
jgi:exosome complex component RRP4